jgi:hypothetical protein
MPGVQCEAHGSRERDGANDARALSRHRLARDLTADGLDAVVHVAQSASGVLVEREPGPVVTDFEAQACARLAESDRDFGGAAGVLDRVLQRSAQVK